MKQQPLFLVAILFAFCLFSAFATSTPKGVFAGGAVDYKNTAIYNAFIQQATPVGGVPYIGIITAGVSLDVAYSTALISISQFKNFYKVKNVEWLPFHIDNATTCQSAAWNEKISQMTGIFINGGNSQPMLDCFIPNGVPSPALQAVKEAYSCGALAVFGSSAGAATLQGNPFLKIQDSWNAIAFNLLYIKTGGMGIFNSGFMDVHFSTRGRQGALARLLYDLKSYQKLAFGVDQNTAMVSNDPAKFTVAGAAGVYVFSNTAATNATQVVNKKVRWGVKNIKVHYFTANDTYNWNTGGYSWGVNKKKVVTTSQAPLVGSDIFADGVFTAVTQSLFNSAATSTYGVTSETAPQYRIDFRKVSSSISVSRVVDGVTYQSYSNLYMDIYCYYNC